MSAPPSQSRHITRDFRNLRPGGNGRELEIVGTNDEFPPDGDVHDTSEGALWKTSQGWYQRQGDYWAPILEPHEPGVLEAVTAASRGNMPCRDSGWDGCSGAELDAGDFVDDLAEAGWRIVRAEP